MGKTDILGNNELFIQKSEHNCKKDYTSCSVWMKTSDEPFPTYLSSDLFSFLVNPVKIIFCSFQLIWIKFTVQVFQKQFKPMLSINVHP